MARCSLYRRTIVLGMAGLCMIAGTAAAREPLQYPGINGQLQVGSFGSEDNSVTTPVSTRWTMSETVKLLASDAAAEDNFGLSASMTNGFAVVGAPGKDDDAGAVYVFQRDKGGTNHWGQEAKIVASDAAAINTFGRSVAIDDYYLVVGESYGGPDLAGRAYVYKRVFSGVQWQWQEQAQLVPPVPDSLMEFGCSVAIDGDTVVVGAKYAVEGGTGTGDETGAAYVFQRDQGGADNWGWVADLWPVAGDHGDRFGISVSISGDAVAVGAEESFGPGSAYLFYRDYGGPDSWDQWLQLTVADGTNGDEFGHSVSISGEILVVGAPRDDEPLSASGSAYVFNQNSGGGFAWGQVGKLTPSDGGAEDNFGESVAVDGDRIVVGAPWDDNDTGVDAGTVYVFDHGEGGLTDWSEVGKLRGSDTGAGDVFGVAVAIMSNGIVAGAYGHDSEAGAAYLFLPLMFADGFESGDTSAWSSQVVKSTASR